MPCGAASAAPSNQGFVVFDYGVLTVGGRMPRPVLAWGEATDSQLIGAIENTTHLVSELPTQHT